MAEPIGLIASIVGIAQGVGVLAYAIDNIRNAPESVKVIRNDLGLLTPALKKLKAVIDERGPGFTDLGPEIQATLDRTHEACAEFKISLDHWTRHSTEKGTSLIDMVNIGVFKQSRIKIMKDQVNQCIKTLEVTLTTSTTLQMARQEVMMKDVAETMMASFEEKLKTMIIEVKTNGQELVKFQAEAAVSNEEDEEKGLLTRDIQRHKETINIFEETAQKALKAVTFERTGQKIYKVKATDHSITLTGLVNAENVRVEQDIDNISADKYSLATAGVVNNLDLKDFYSQMYGRGH